MGTIKCLTRDMIRAIKPMSVAEFYLPSARSCQSARTQVQHVKNFDGYTLKCHIDVKERKVVIMRLDDREYSKPVKETK